MSAESSRALRDQTQTEGASEFLKGTLGIALLQSLVAGVGLLVFPLALEVGLCAAFNQILGLAFRTEAALGVLELLHDVSSDRDLSFLFGTAALGDDFFGPATYEIAYGFLQSDEGGESLPEISFPLVNKYVESRTARLWSELRHWQEARRRVPARAGPLGCDLEAPRPDPAADQ